jgi:hypothetical protein
VRSARGPAAPQRELLLYLDQNYLSGIVKRKVAFRELEPVLRAAVSRGAVAVPESEAHRLESAAPPDLPLMELLRELSAGVGCVNSIPLQMKTLAASVSLSRVRARSPD